MGVYVDQIRHYPNCKWQWKYWSHMFADTSEELHAMAHRLGMQPEWFQEHRTNPNLSHYDITPSKRRVAIRYGAVEEDTKQFIRRIKLC